MGLDPYVGCNLNIEQYLCTLDTCCLAQSHFNYRPSFGGNVFFAVIFGVLILPQLALGIYYKTWGFAVAMFFGLALEVVGYASRVLLYNDPFSDNPFLM